MSALGREAAGDAPSIVVADRDMLLRTGVARTLRAAGFRVCAEVDDAAVAVEAVVRHRPDVCLVSLRLPGDPLEATRTVRRVAPGTQVVILTRTEGEAEVLAAVRAGATGYLLKDMDPDRLATALLKVVAGEPAIPRRLVGVLVHALQRQHASRLDHVPPGAGLSGREIQVLELLVEGLETAAIASRLGISAVTVRRHLSTAMAKLGAPDRGAAVRILTSAG